MKNHLINHSSSKPGGRPKTFLFASALLSAAILSVTVFGAVTYDSSKDPVVAQSAMHQYVTGELEGIRASIASIEQRLALVELTGGGSGSGSGTGTGSGSGISSEGAAQILARLSELESGLAEVRAENERLSAELTAAKQELRSLISSLQTDVNSLSTSISTVRDNLTSLQSTVSSAKNDISTLKTDFRQISDISTKLNTLTYRVNNLTGDGGDLAKIREELQAVTDSYNDMLEKAGRFYKAVYVPYGSTVVADGQDDCVMVILRTGSAEAVSPFNEPGTAQGLNDLSGGDELNDGDSLSLFRNYMIPRGGTDGRGVRVTSLEGAYLMIGGNYRIVEP